MTLILLRNFARSLKFEVFEIISLKIGPVSSTMEHEHQALVPTVPKSFYLTIFKLDPSLSDHLEFVPTVPQSFYLTIFKLDPSLK